MDATIKCMGDSCDVGNTIMDEKCLNLLEHHMYLPSLSQTGHRWITSIHQCIRRLPAKVFPL